MKKDPDRIGRGPSRGGVGENRTHVEGFAGPCLNHSATTPRAPDTSAQTRVLSTADERCEPDAAWAPRTAAAAALTTVGIAGRNPTLDAPARPATASQASPNAAICTQPVSGSSRCMARNVPMPSARSRAPNPRMTSAARGSSTTEPTQLRPIRLGASSSAVPTPTRAMDRRAMTRRFSIRRFYRPGPRMGRDSRSC